MAEDLWRPDEDPRVAAVEGRLTDALTNYLYRVHLGAHRALELPQVDAQALRDAYRTPTLAKADHDSHGRAAQTFAALRQQPRGARDARELAHALAHGWFERGLIADEAERAAVTARAFGLIAAGGVVPGEPGGYAAWRASITDPDAARAVEWAAQHALEHATRLRDTTRAVLASAVVDALIAGDSPQALAQRLVSQFGTLNRDARRLAVTEVSAARSHGFLAGVPDGEQVEWFAAPDACPHCRRYHGRRFTVRSSPGDFQTEVWAGKTNAGRAFTSHRMDKTERGAGELAGPTIPLHPNCRCRWVRVSRPTPGVSPRLEAMLAALSAS